MRLWVIVNPAAGHGKAARKAPQFEARLRDNGVEVDVAVSQYPGHVLEIVNGAEDLARYDGIVAIGGDGTLYEIINSLMRKEGRVPLPLGQIPVGTGSSLSRDLHPDGDESAIHKIVHGQTRKIDLIEYRTADSTGYFSNMMGIGFVSDINARSFRYKALGKLAYALSVLLELAHPRTARTKLRLDGRIVELETLFVEVCNSRWTGGNMLIAPMAELDDGLADVLVCKPMRRLRLLRVFPKVFNGSHMGLPEVEAFRAVEGSIEMDPPRLLSPDGEVLGETPVHFRCLPQALEVFA